MANKTTAQEGGSILIAYRIVQKLRSGPVTSQTLVHEMWLSENAANRHLRAAVAAGLVERRTDVRPYAYELK